MQYFKITYNRIISIQKKNNTLLHIVKNKISYDMLSTNKYRFITQETKNCIHKVQITLKVICNKYEVNTNNQMQVYTV